MSTVKFMYVIGAVSLVSIVLYFITSLDLYSWDDLVQGFAFFGAAGVAYFVFVYLYHKNEAGQKMTVYVLGFLAIASVALIFIG